MLSSGLKGALIGGIAGGTLGGVAGGLQNRSNDLTFFGGELTGDNFLAHEYIFDEVTGKFKYYSNLGGKDLHFYHIGHYTDAGSAFVYRTTKVIEGANTINAFRFWESASSTISAFSAPASGLTGYFLEPRGPSTTTPKQNRRVPAGNYSLSRNYSRFPNDFMIYNQDVSIMRGITIHEGFNYKYTKGCLLPGTWSGGDEITNSMEKLIKLRAHINNAGYRNVHLNIYDLF